MIVRDALNPDRLEWLFTAADLAALPNSLPSGDVDFELDRGKLVIRLPRTYAASSAMTYLSISLFEYAEQGHGRAWPSIGIVLWKNPDRVVAAAAAYLSNASEPLRLSPEDWLETMPDIVCEVEDAWQPDGYLARKVDDYLSAGVRLIWVVHPKRREIVEYRAGLPIRVYSDGEDLTAPGITPGFRLPVSEVFARTWAPAKEPPER